MDWMFRVLGIYAILHFQHKLGITDEAPYTESQSNSSTYQTESQSRGPLWFGSSPLVKVLLLSRAALDTALDTREASTTGLGPTPGGLCFANA